MSNKQINPHQKKVFEEGKYSFKLDAFEDEADNESASDNSY